jgi:hypothetical protein
VSIKKQEFYEGAALHVLARGDGIAGIRYRSPFFEFNGSLAALLKYSTRGRSPWGFTFVPAEQVLMEQRAAERRLVIGLICGADGVAAFSYEDYRNIAAPRATAIHVACYRKHGKHYEVSGPDGTIGHKVAPATWRRLLGELGESE